VVSRTFGIILFLVLLVVLLLLVPAIDNQTFTRFVEFLLDNAGLIVFLSLLFMIGEIFTTFIFPLNLPAPLFNAIGSVFLITFLFRIFAFVEELYGLGIFAALSLIELVVYPLVFILVLIAGYFEIFSGLARHDDRGERSPENRSTTVPSDRSGGKTWDEIGNEFRQMVYDIIHRFREEINRK
jgi:hypothetical protein